MRNISDYVLLKLLVRAVVTHTHSLHWAFENEMHVHALKIATKTGCQMMLEHIQRG